MSKRVSVLKDTMLALGAGMGEWNDMDVAFTLSSDPRSEHTAIREAAGLWDTSALKKIHVRGKDALAAVDYLVTRDSVGHVTTPAFSERLGQSLALVHLVPSAALPGTKIQVVGKAMKCAASVTRIPFVDPERKRLRAP